MNTEETVAIKLVYSVVYYDHFQEIRGLLIFIYYLLLIQESIKCRHPQVVLISFNPKPIYPCNQVYYCIASSVQLAYEYKLYKLLLGAGTVL